MTLIIGLGNPGEKFEHTRHNAGFMAVDFFASEHDFPAFELEKKYEALVSEKNKTILAKPQTFMNDSGKTARKITKTHTVKPNAFIVIHDDTDIELGKFKIVKNRGSAGHKGVESIIKAVGNKNLIRVRVGTQTTKKHVAAENTVLKKFSSSEQKIIKKTIARISKALDVLLEEGLEQAMNEYNR